MVRNPYALYELDQNCDSGTRINPLSAVLELFASLAVFGRYNDAHKFLMSVCVCFADPLTSHMEMVTEIVVPTVCTLSILLSAIFLMFLLRRRN